jgi:hypothetical protein
MEVLSRFQSIDDLIESIELIFTRLDADGSGTIGFFEISDGLNGILPNIYLSLENLMDLKKTLHPAEEFSADGFELSQQEFQTVCVSHLKDYLLREANKVCTALKGNWTSCTFFLHAFICLLALFQAGERRQNDERTIVFDDQVFHDANTRLTWMEEREVICGRPY